MERKAKKAAKAANPRPTKRRTRKRRRNKAPTSIDERHSTLCNDERQYRQATAFDCICAATIDISALPVIASRSAEYGDFSDGIHSFSLSSLHLAFTLSHALAHPCSRLLLPVFFPLLSLIFFPLILPSHLSFPVISSPSISYPTSSSPISSPLLSFPPFSLLMII